MARDLFTGEVERFVVDSPREYERLVDLVGSYAPHLRDRLELYRGREPIFEHYGVEREIETALQRKVWLPSGGTLVVDRTEAFTVIDVNTGRYVGDRDLATTILHTNLEAAREVVRQIRLRDIGGIILVDFIDMDNEKHRQQVLRALQEAVRRDRSKTQVIDLTQLGLVEITRKRVHQDLEAVLRMPCPYCNGRGRVLSPETVANRIRRELRRWCSSRAEPVVVVRVHPLVHAELVRDGAWLRRLEEQTGKTVRVVPKEGLHVEQFETAGAARPEEAEGVPAVPVPSYRWGPEEVLDVGAEPDRELERAEAAQGQEGWWDRLRRWLGRMSSPAGPRI